MPLYNPSEDKEQNNVVSQFDTIYQNAVGKLGKNATDKQHKEIIRQINLFGYNTAYDEPLWQKSPAEIDSISRHVVTSEVTTTPYTPPEQPSISLPEPVKPETEVTSTSQIPTQPVVDSELPTVKLNMPFGEPVTLTATGMDKFGKPIFVSQTKGQSLIDEWNNWTMQMAAVNAWEANKDYEQSRKNAEYEVQARKSQGGVSEVAPATKEEIQKRLPITNFENFVKSIGRGLLSGAQMSIGVPFNFVERTVGVAALQMAKNIESSGIPKDLTMEEAVQASRLAFNVFGEKQNLMAEFVRRYREDPNADPSEIEKEIGGNIWSELVIGLIADPMNELDKINKINKTISALGKANTLSATDDVVRMFDNLDNVANGLKNIEPEVANAVEDVVKQADVLGDVTRDVIRSVDNTMPIDAQLPIAKRNIELADQDFLSKRQATDVAKENLKQIKLTGTPEEILAAETEAKNLGKIAQDAKKVSLKWTKNYKEIATKAENARVVFTVQDSLTQAVGKADGIKSAIPNPKADSVKSALNDAVVFTSKKFDDVENEMTAMAKNFTDTTMKKVAILGDNVKDTMTLVMASNPDIDDFGDVVASMMVLARKDSSDLAKQLAMATIARNPARQQILSPAGMKTAIALRDMMTSDKGVTNIAGIRKIIETAKTMPNPMEYLAIHLDERAVKSVAKIFPDMAERVSNAEKIGQLLAEKKPIPAYLKRFMVDGKAEEIPTIVKKTIKAHEFLQKKAGVAWFNKMMSSAFIAANPPTWFRNAANNAFTIGTDGGNPFMLGSDMDRILNTIGRPSQTFVGMGGTAAAIPGTEHSKFIEFVGKLNTKIEKFQATQIVTHTLKKTWDDQFKVIFRDMQPALKMKGFTDDEILKITSKIKMTGNVDQGIAEAFDMNTHRVLSDFVDENTMSALSEYGLDTHIDDALKGTAQEAKQRVLEIFSKAKALGDDAGFQEGMIDPDSKYFSEVEDILSIPEEFIGAKEIDYIGRKTIATQEAFEKAGEVISGWRTTIREGTQKLALGLDPVKQQELFTKANQASKIIDDAEQQFKAFRTMASKWRQTVGADILSRAKNAEKTDRELAGMLYNEFKQLREEIWTKTGQQQIAAYQKAIQDSLGVMKGINVTPPNMDGFTKAVDTVSKWNDVDVDVFNALGKAISKSTGEELITDTDAYMNLQNAFRGADEGLQNTLNKILENIDNNFDSVQPVKLTPDKAEALKDFARVARERVSVAKAKSFEVANLAREFTMLDYRKKMTADLALAYIFPYQFWYSRSYKNWMKRIVNQPGMMTNYMRYRSALEKVNADMPEWYRYNVNIGHMIGLPEDNPLFFNLESMINPLNGLLGMDFNDSRRRKDTFPMVIDALGKYGPSTHPLYSYGIAAAYAIGGDADTAEAWASRLVPQTRLLKDITSTIPGYQSVVEVAKNSGVDITRWGPTPGGFELDPVIIAMGGIDPYEKKRVSRKLAELVQRGEITPEAAAEASYTHKGDAWNKAWQYAQNDPESPWYERRAELSAFGGFFGTGLKGRTQEDVLNDKFFEEYSLLKGVQNNLSPSEYKQKLVGLFERYPFGEYLVLARKSDKFRDQAWAYSVLDRIEPGQLSEFAKQAGLDPNILDKFYEDKGRIDQWDESDKNKFMAAIRDMSVVIEIPDTATSHDYDVARIRSMQLNEYLKEKYGENILEKMNAIYDIDANDAGARDDYIQSNPDVQAALEEKDQTILADPILNDYFGGVDKLESYFEYQKRGEAVKLFGDNIFELVAAYYRGTKNGFDVRALKEDNPQLAEYFTWNTEQRQMIDQAINEWGSQHLPSSASNIVNPKAIINSVGQEQLAKFMQESNPNAKLDEILAPYATKRPEADYTGSFSMAKFIDEEAEKRWNGITQRIKEFEASKVNPALASQLWASDPTISAYYTFVRGIQSQAAQAEKGMFAPQDIKTQIQDAMSPELYRLALDKVNGKELSASAEKQLKRVATNLGITYNELLMYLLQ